MLDFLRWIQLKQETPPGSLVYAGEPRDFTPYASCIAYDEAGFSDDAVDISSVTRGCGRVNLVTVVGIHDAEIIKQIGSKLSFPILALEDVLHTGQRAKMSWVDDNTAFVVARDLRLEEGTLCGEQVSIFWRGELVVVFLETESDLLDGVIGRIKKGKGRIRREGGAYLTCALLDALVDRQMGALAQCSEAAESLEEQLLSNVTDDLLGQVYELKREILLFRNQMTPIRDIFKTLMREDAEIPDSVYPYLRDTAGHLEQVVDGTTVLHDILKSMIDHQISLIGMHTNRVMQFLTVIATIFIPLTFIAGVYGMNFTNMPELTWKYGYVTCLGLMGVVGILMLIVFIRKRML